MSTSLHGFNDVIQALKAEPPPITKARMVAAFGHMRVGQGTDQVEVRELVARLGDDDFPTSEQACAALHEVACNALPTDAADAAVDEIGIAEL